MPFHAAHPKQLRGHAMPEETPVKQHQLQPLSHRSRLCRLPARIAFAAAALGTFAAPAAADWKPARPVEFVVSAGPGGGTDQFARVVQSIVQKYKLLPVPVVVTNKGGGAGTEAFVYGRSAAGDANKLLFSTNLAYLMPMITKVGYRSEDMRPVAIMAADEFLLWTHQDAPYKNAKDLIDDARARNGAFKMGGAQSKDTDHILTRQIEKATGVKMTYVPFKSGGEVAVQLAGGHIDANTNNPSENISHWKAGKVRPLCVFAAKRLTIQEKVTADKGFADVPTCKESGIPIDEFRMPRTVWLPAGVTDEQQKYYVDLMAKVREKPEWKEWLQRGSQSDFFLSGAPLKAYIDQDMRKHQRQFGEDGWLIKE